MGVEYHEDSISVSRTPVNFYHHRHFWPNRSYESHQNARPLRVSYHSRHVPSSVELPRILVCEVGDERAVVSVPAFPRVNCPAQPIYPKKNCTSRYMNDVYTTKQWYHGSVTYDVLFEADLTLDDSVSLTRTPACWIPPNSESLMRRVDMALLARKTGSPPMLRTQLRTWLGGSSATQKEPRRARTTGT